MLNDRRLARLTARALQNSHGRPGHDRPGLRKIVSWNLLRRVGANVAGIAALIEREQPDLVLMQEATKDIEALQAKVGGHYAWAQMPGRIHGLAVWSPMPFATPPKAIELPAGAMFDRVSQVIDLGEFGVANVHLSHGQMLNRRQLRCIEQSLPDRAAVIGDYNLVGPTLLPGFRDVGPRLPTHAMARVVPLRLDRCLVRGLTCHGRSVLPRGASDHRPIIVHLAPTHEVIRREPEEPERVKGMAGVIGRLRRAAGRGDRAGTGARASAGRSSSPA
ncbi:endonuclease [Methylobacterium sp. Leaf104]|uniref:endonuclease/exonuclease/phosphatase family protein n=1 Tax=Methylobacterium TaxID=407 RepID=UPI0006F928DD|nr:MULTISPECIES: endonuclease/exonuclease/phosphatase family protein [Methylobacterium]KQP30922.1 endonuclease [Methylobacterium sp. Leaf104]MCI9879208.1 endonuclease/exonuclease/phosphatase family protein [Methylobacterium goesingense]